MKQKVKSGIYKGDEILTFSCRNSSDQYSRVGKTWLQVFSHQTWWSSWLLPRVLSSGGFRVSWQSTTCRTSFTNCTQPHACTQHFSTDVIGLTYAKESATRNLHQKY